METPEHIRDEEAFGIFTIRRGKLVELATTSKDGIGQAITTLVSEGEFRDSAERQRPLGILDRRLRDWVINPFAPGSVA